MGQPENTFPRFFASDPHVSHLHKCFVVERGVNVAKVRTSLSSFNAMDIIFRLLCKELQRVINGWAIASRGFEIYRTSTVDRCCRGFNTMLHGWSWLSYLLSKGG